MAVTGDREGALNVQSLSYGVCCSVLTPFTMFTALVT
jgi:hypothetical protein